MDQTALALPEALLEREHEVERIRGAVRAAWAGLALVVLAIAERLDTALRGTRTKYLRRLESAARR